MKRRIFGNPGPKEKGGGHCGSPRRPLTPEEVVRLERTPCGRQAVKDAFLFSCYTGLRLSDILRLRLRDLKLFSRRLWIDIMSKKRGNHLLVPLSRCAQRVIGHRAGGYLSSLRHGDPDTMPQGDSILFGELPSPTTIRIHIKRWCEEAGIGRRVCFHSARHTFATSLVDAGVDLYIVAELLGHRSVRTSCVYARVPERRMREEMERLDVLMREAVTECGPRDECD